jgi:hypothetical protein
MRTAVLVLSDLGQLPKDSPLFYENATDFEIRRVSHADRCRGVTTTTPQQPRASMGFLKRFFSNVFEEEQARLAGSKSASASGSFAQLSEEELESHLRVSKYGNFELSEAIRPSHNLEIVPSAGFRHDVYRDEQSRSNVPVLMAAVSKEQMIETFISLIQPLGEVVDVVLETSHGQAKRGHTDLYREYIDMPILESTLWDFEDLLANDGCTGIAVLNPNVPQEVQLDEHKLLIVYGSDLKAYESLLVDARVPCREDMRFITEAEHVHSTSERYVQEFEELKMRLGMDRYR